jgi:predicted nuclease of predicted toxin-antitoxin system
MRLLLDQGVPRDAASLLRNAGYDCSHVSESGMSRAADAEILAHALAWSAIVVTLDADFHMILAVTMAAAPSAIRIRLQGLGGTAVATIVQRALDEFGDELARGSLVTVKSNKITCHRLPIGADRD